MVILPGFGANHVSSMMVIRPGFGANSLPSPSESKGGRDEYYLRGGRGVHQ